MRWFPGLAVLMVLLVPDVADACSCRAPGPPCDAVFRAQAIFSGEVVSIEPVPPPALPARPAGYPPPPPVPSPFSVGKRVTLRVDKTWVGAHVPNIDVLTGPDEGSCGFEFVEGQRYLVYANAFGGALHVSRCSRTRPIADAGEDEAFLTALPRIQPRGRIFGKALFAGEPRKPAANVPVLLGNEDGTWTTRTDANGVFEFPNRRAGKYGIGLDVEEPWRAVGPALVELRDTRGCAHAAFIVSAPSSVMLHVLDHRGRPAVRTTLELIEADSVRTGQLKAWREGTNGDGSVGWGSVPPGRYLIGVNVSELPDPRRPQATLFYPGVTEVASAHTFEVTAGETVRLDTLRLPLPPLRRDIAGRVLRADGTVVKGADVVLLSANRFSRGRRVGRAVRTDAEGRFTLPAATGSRYTVEVLLGVDGEKQEVFARTPEFEWTEKSPPLTIQPQRR